MNPGQKVSSVEPPEGKPEIKSGNTPACLRVLILEDVATDAELIERELRKAGVSFSSRCVETREAFLLALNEFAPDVILSDFSMPQCDAIEALELLHEQPRD